MNEPDDISRRQQLRNSMTTAIRDGDLEAIEKLLSERPEFLHGRFGPLSSPDGTWLHLAAECGNFKLVRYFFDQGIGLNTFYGDRRSGCCPLSDAIRSGGDLEMVRWMIDHGADPSLSKAPMVDAAYRGDVEILKLLVEHGSEINFLFADGTRTPLSLALLFGRTEAAEYLRSVGAIMPPPISRTEADERLCSTEQQHADLVAYLHEKTGRDPDPMGMQEIVPGLVQVSVWTIQCEHHQILFTSGMSSRAMSVSADHEADRFAELVMFLPLDWPRPPPLDSPAAWPFKWLRRIAHFPHDNNTWLPGPITAFSNGDPPHPLEPDLPYVAFLLMFGHHFPEFTSSDDRKIRLATVLPIYPEEYAMTKRNAGFFELYARLANAKAFNADMRNRVNVAQ